MIWRIPCRHQWRLTWHKVDQQGEQQENGPTTPTTRENLETTNYGNTITDDEKSSIGSNDVLDRDSKMNKFDYMEDSSLLGVTEEIDDEIPDHWKETWTHTLK